MNGFLSIRYREGDNEVIEADTGGDVWYAVKVLRATADHLSEWAEAQEAKQSKASGTAGDEHV